VSRLANAPSAAALFGLAIAALGVAGFVPGLVQQYGDLHWWRAGSGAELFGLFQTSILHNLVHVGIGAAGIAAARTVAGARGYLALGGAVVFALGAYGLVIDRLGDANVLPVNRADDWLHLGLGVAMLYAGIAVSAAALRPAA
jgi:hypothetical protein